MGLFGKKPVNQSGGKSAADVFAERDKGHMDTGDADMANRITGYNTLKGAETVRAKQAAAAPPPPSGRIEELREIREKRARGEDYEEKQAQAKAAEITAASVADKSAASDAITARKNLLSSDGIKRREGPSEEERAAIQRSGMSTLNNVTDGIKNKQFLTEVNEEIGEILQEKRAAIAAQKPEDKNLTVNEVGAATAKFRNVGFFTETEVFEGTHVKTEEEKLHQELEELESAEQAIRSMTNVGFRNQVQKVDNLVGDALGGVPGEKQEGEGE